ncbi:MAG: class I SAM-dependent methyltransferase [Fluviicola sp.]
MKERILSPLTHSENVCLIGEIPAKQIIEIYQSDQGMDVSPVFSGIETIQLYRCNATGFEFFWPFHIAGDDLYYQELAKRSWYYDPNRWEHREVIKELKKSEHILEVGCGNGDFLKKIIAETSCVIEALELNSNSVKKLLSEGLQVSEMTLENYASQSSKQFDIVCSFQVLEHVSTPYEFLKDQIKLLKSGGKLIIGVPNNDSYIGSNKHVSRILNEPPHHMGRWKLNSLSALEKIFPELKLIDVKYEPMIGENIDVYTWNVTHRLLFKNAFLTKVVWKLRLYKPLEWIIHLFKNKIKGQTILVTYLKQ